MADEEQKQPSDPIDVHAVLAVMVEQMASIAWSKLGLQPDMMTGKIEKDLDQAKVAIDVTWQMAAFLESNLDEPDQRRIHSLMRDLKLNYIEKRKEAGDGE